MNEKGQAMYTIIERRKVNHARVHETEQAAQDGPMSKLPTASGFVGLYLVEDTEAGVNTQIVVWESKAHADAFQQDADSWNRMLDAHGHRLESANRGETVIHVDPRN